MIALREEVLPLYSLKEILGMKFEEQDIYPVVVVQAGIKSGLYCRRAAGAAGGCH